MILTGAEVSLPVSGVVVGLGWFGGLPLLGGMPGCVSSSTIAGFKRSMATVSSLFPNFSLKNLSSRAETLKGPSYLAQSGALLLYLRTNTIGHHLRASGIRVGRCSFGW